MKDIIQQDNTQKLSKIEKRRAACKAYYQSNKERVLAHYHANKEQIKERSKKYREATREKRNAYYMEYRKANKEKVKEYHKEYHKANKEKRDAYIKGYYEANKEQILAKQTKYVNKKYHTDEMFKLKHSLRQYTVRAFKRIGCNKSAKTLDLLGCTWEEAKAHIESKFVEGMTWANHGKWHIDHIIPIASATTIEDVYKLNHISNLQPLWAKDNLIKSARIAPQLCM